MYNSFFKKHPEVVFIGLTICFLAILATFYVWGLINLAGLLNKTLIVETGSDGNDLFDLEGARGLNLKGLIE